MGDAVFEHYGMWGAGRGGRLRRDGESARVRANGGGRVGRVKVERLRWVRIVSEGGGSILAS